VVRTVTEEREGYVIEKPLLDLNGTEFLENWL